ncbi:hypothetical protein [Granulicella sp. S190]|uniref:hypothetical protein n=1 Tax=Granulicella sp. S190 TaxID=1747226 RepID=UPI00131B231E|nr:hypothetical protein [Granulicella sp. S190]
MTRTQQFSLLFILTSPTFLFSASIPKAILPDNVVTCQPNANCLSKTLYGRNYKVLNTPRFTVMVAVSKEGAYTRADVSIANNTIMSQSLTPEDFRIEVVTPKPKVLLYISPGDLKDLPQQPIPSQATTPPSPPATPAEPDPQAVANQQKVAEKAATEHPLTAVSLSPNEVTQGRVYFERDKHEHLVNVVLPIAGLVFEFPYNMK